MSKPRHRRTGLSLRAYARHRGVSPEAVRKAIASGRISANGTGIDPEQADSEWALNTRSSMNGHDHDPAYRRARAARMAYAARLTALEYEVLIGKLIPAADVRREAFERARRARDLLLAIPKRLAPVIASLPNPLQCQKALEQEIERALDELSGGAPAAGPGPESPA